MGYSGAVTTNAAGRFVGWCVNLDNPSAPVQVSVYWGERQIKRFETYGKHELANRQYGAPNAAFYFSMTPGLIAKFPKGTNLRLLTPDGMELPLNKAGSFAPIGDADDLGAELTKLLDAGYVIDKWGALKLPFRAMDPALRQCHAESLGKSTTYFQNRFGLTLFPHYGTLLGFARSASFLPHDDDTDTSFVIEGGKLEEVANAFLDVAQTLHEDGLMVRMVSVGQFTVYFPDNQRIGTDVFLSWHNTDTGEFSTYFGVNGHIDQRLTFFESELEGVKIWIPTAYKQILALTYGDSWIVPDPNFSWSRRISELDPVMRKLRDSANDRLTALNELVLTRT